MNADACSLMEYIRHSLAAVRRQTKWQRWLPAAFWLLALALGGLHTWAAAASYSMNADGINYLDLGDAFTHGDWATAVNPVWSPLYGWLLGVVMALVRPSMRWEFPLVHGVNFAIFLLALLCFAFFWQELRRWQMEQADDGRTPLPEWAWQAIGYALFLWAALSLIAIWAVEPDMLMAALVLLAAGLVVRLRRRGGDGWSVYAQLGLLLGLSYLVKAVMFPLAFAFLLAALAAPGNLRRAAPRTLLALALFFLVSLPWVALISRAVDHLTISEAGRLTYLRYAYGIPYPHWQGRPPEFGTPLHPSRLVLAEPPVYEFGEPVGGTYPISYDPGYWYAGATARFDLRRQLALLLTSGLYYFDLFFRQQGVLLAGVLLLYWLGRIWPSSLTQALSRWSLLLPTLAAFALYGLVYVEGRYIGVFLLLWWGEWLANARLPQPVPDRLVTGLSLIMIGFILANLLAFNLKGYSALAGGPPRPPGPPQPAALSWPGEAAETLWALGVWPGDKVGVIGYAFESFWARLARVQIAAELLEWEAAPFWRNDPETRTAVLQAFARAGVTAVVAEYVPPGTNLPGWHRVGDSDFYIYKISSADSILRRGRDP